jgi:DNA-binding XRE family transcriptional regulator
MKGLDALATDQYAAPLALISCSLLKQEEHCRRCIYGAPEQYEGEPMRTLDDAIAARSAESQQRIRDMADEMVLETGLQMMREELQLSQKNVAEAMGISQPAITQLEQRGNELKIATLKRYIEAMGGKLSLDVELPSGKRIAFHL